MLVYKWMSSLTYALDKRLQMLQYQPVNLKCIAINCLSHQLLAMKCIILAAVDKPNASNNHKVVSVEPSIANSDYIPVYSLIVDQILLVPIPINARNAFRTLY